MRARVPRKPRLDLESYLGDREVFGSLLPAKMRYLTDQVEHFTVNEAEHRDEIVYRYFGKEGVTRLADLIAKAILSSASNAAPRILDVGSGAGTFTLPIVQRVKGVLPRSAFYAMDLTPAMLRVLAQRTDNVTPFVGIAENISKSINHARGGRGIPRAFDFIISTLALHHVQDVGKAFESFSGVLKDSGKVLLVDMCEHNFPEFREEMGDYHLGFNLKDLENLAELYFSKAQVKRLPAGYECSDTGRSVRLFLLTMSRPRLRSGPSPERTFTRLPSVL
jgi:SAM-dependent methyltransferase